LFHVAINLENSGNVYQLLVAATAKPPHSHASKEKARMAAEVEKEASLKSNEAFSIPAVVVLSEEPALVETMSSADTLVAPDGGWLAWFQVAGSFTLFVNTW
jgi:hypothetical protein